jgi:uncharacterized protein (TIGR03067 family)
MLKTGKRVCKDDQVTVNVGGMLIMKAKFTLDPTKTPKTIDYQVTEGPNAGKTQLGIYELADDGTAKFCFAAPGKDRPDAFENQPADGRTLSVWQKQQAEVNGAGGSIVQKNSHGLSLKRSHIAAIAVLAEVAPA